MAKKSIFKGISTQDCIKIDYLFNEHIAYFERVGVTAKKISEYFKDYDPVSVRKIIQHMNDTGDYIKIFGSYNGYKPVTPMTKEEAISVYKARKSRAKKACKNLDKQIKEIRSM